jgi:hypothetical protein
VQYVFVIYQGFSPIPADEEAWATLTPDEQKQVYADYGALNREPGLTPGLPLGLPEDATTIRVRNGRTVAAPGTFLGAHGAVAGTMVCEADDLDAAVAQAARIPAARLGGAVEIRPVATYW